MTYRTRPMQTMSCHACMQPTPWTCHQCGQAVCARCQVSMYAMCQPCRSAYHGEINLLGKRADLAITAEFERMFMP